MDADLKKMKKLARAMRKEGILNYKTPEIEISLAPAAISLDSEETTPQPMQSDKAEPEEVDEMTALLWSAPGGFDAQEAS